MNEYEIGAQWLSGCFFSYSLTLAAMSHDEFRWIDGIGLWAILNGFCSETFFFVFIDLAVFVVNNILRIGCSLSYSCIEIPIVSCDEVESLSLDLLGFCFFFLFFSVRFLVCASYFQFENGTNYSWFSDSQLTRIHLIWIKIPNANYWLWRSALNCVFRFFFFGFIYPHYMAIT